MLFINKKIESWMKKSTKNGFTLIESLISLMICSIVSLIGVIYIQTCMNVVSMKPLHQNQLAILQLRQIASLSHDIHVENNALVMIYEHEEIRWVQDGNRLVQRDGYEIWMEGIEDVSFQENEDEIYLLWTFNGQRYQSQIV